MTTHTHPHAEGAGIRAVVAALAADAGPGSALQAMQLAKPDADTLANDQRKRELEAYEELHAVCRSLGSCDSGCITVQQLERHLGEGLLGARLAILGLHVTDAQRFFDALSAGGPARESPGGGRSERIQGIPGVCFECATGAKRRVRAPVPKWEARSLYYQVQGSPRCVKIDRRSVAVCGFPRQTDSGWHLSTRSMCCKDSLSGTLQQSQICADSKALRLGSPNLEGTSSVGGGRPTLSGAPVFAPRRRLRLPREGPGLDRAHNERALGQHAGSGAGIRPGWGPVTKRCPHPKPPRPRATAFRNFGLARAPHFASVVCHCRHQPVARSMKRARRSQARLAQCWPHLPKVGRLADDFGRSVAPNWPTAAKFRAA